MSQGATFHLGIKTSSDLSGLNQVKKALQEVKDLANTDYGMSAEFSSAVRAAENLELAFNSAFDPKLGVASVSKFNNSLKQSGTSLTEVAKDLHYVGVTGQKAFLQATGQLMQMNKTVVQTNAFIDKLAKSFANSLRYQVMNVAIQKVTGSISEAYGYVKRLDGSLNDIQIVTEKNTASMKEFAKQANNAAKSLGAGTVDYTDASLIYYQQGLSDEEVLNRTNTTMKMANVLGESASKVSDYMTAIWNNFDNGSKSLEYYGDVITSLGAHTASSAAEIAEGIEKFAAVAETSGLSYEYATAALATVVAETRQSADTVGTAFKTLFGRLEGLKLGETLEDGTTLNKYSKALDTVGVSIKDASGQLRSMDDILNDLGARWKSLSDDQQVALAQTVGGVRQYNQLIALMNNWDKVLNNVNLALDSNGTLDKKQAIYMDSLSAKTQQLTTQWEAFYDSLINEQTLKDLTDSLTKLAKFMTSFSDSVGGLGPILTMLGPVALRVFSTQIGSSIGGAIHNMTTLREATKTYEENVIELQAIAGNSEIFSKDGNAAILKKNILNELVEIYKEMHKYASVLSQDELDSYNEIVKMKVAAGELAIELENISSKWNNKAQKGTFFSGPTNIDTSTEEGKQQVANLQSESNLLRGVLESSNTSGFIGEYRSIIESSEDADAFVNYLNNLSPEEFKNNFANVTIQILEQIGNAFLEQGKTIDDFKNKLEEIGIADEIIDNINQTSENSLKINTPQVKRTVQEEQLAYREEYANILKEIEDKKIRYGHGPLTKKDMKKAEKEAKKNHKPGTKDLEISAEQVDAVAKTLNKTEEAANGAVKELEHVAAEERNLGEAADGALEKLLDGKALELGIAKVTQAVGAIGQLAASINILKNIGSIWENNDLTTGEKWLQTIQNAGMVIPMMTSAYNSFLATLGLENGLIKSVVLAKKADLGITTVFNKTKAAENLLSASSVVLKKGEKELTEEETKEFIKLATAEGVENAAKTLGITITEAQNVVVQKAIALQKAWNKAILSSPWVIIGAVVIGAIAAVVTLTEKAKKAEQEKAEAEKDSAQKQLDDAKKKLDALEEEKSKVEELANAYKELADAYDETNLEELQRSAFNLCMQYGDEERAVKALSASYEELNELMSAPVVEKAKEIKEQAEKSLELAEQYGEKAIGSYITSSKDGNKEYSAEFFIHGLDKEQEGFKKKQEYEDLLNTLNIGYNKDKETGQISFNTSDFLNAAKGDVEGFIEEIQNNRELLEYSGLNVDDLLTLLNNEDLTKVFEEIEQNQKAYEEAVKNFAISQIDKDIDTFDEYEQQAQKIVDEVKDSIFEGDEGKAREWARQQLSLISSEFSSYTKSSLLLDALIGDENADEQKLKDYVNTLSDVEKDFLLTYSNLIKPIEPMTEDELDEMHEYDADGNVDLFHRPMVAMDDGSYATVYRSTFSNEDGTKAINFTPIIADKDGNYIGMMSEEELQEYAEGVIAGTREDDLNLQIGGVFEGEDAINKAVAAAERIHELQEKYYADTSMAAAASNFLEENGGSLAIRQSVSNVNQVQDLLNNSNKDTKVDSNLLFNNQNFTGFEDTTGLDQVSFDKMEFGEQQLQMIDYYQKEQAYLKENRELLEERISTDIEEIETNGEYAEALEQSKLAMQGVAVITSTLKDSNGELKFSQDEVLAAIEEMQSQGEGLEGTNEGLSASTIAVKNAMVAAGRTTDQVNNIQVDAIKKSKDYTDKLNLLKFQLDNVNKSEYNHAAVSAELKESLDAINESIDACQSAYKTLTSTVDEYNEKGYLTMDTLQSIWDMDWKYLATLDIKNGKVEMSQTLFENLANAQIDQMEAEAVLKAESDILALTQDDVNSATQGVDSATNALTIDMAELIQKLAEGKEAWDAYYIAQSQGEYAGSAAAKPIIDGLYNALSLAESTRSNLGTHFKDIYGGGKSSGGGSSSKKDKELKDLDDLYDRYYILKKAINDVEDALSDLDKYKSHLSGKQLIDSLKNENNLLKEQETRYNNLYAEQKKHQAELQSSLGAAGMTFNADGNISNYGASVSAAVAAYNNAVSAYNSGGLSEESFAAAESAYNAFKSQLSTYQSLLTDMQDTENKLDDIYYKNIENNKTIWETEIQIKVDWNNLETEWNEFLHDINKDVTLYFNNNIEDIKLNVDNEAFLRDNLSTYMASAQKAGEEIAKFAADPNYQSDMFVSISEAQASLTDINSKIQECATSLKENFVAAWEKYLAEIDQASEKLDGIIDKYEMANTELSHTSQMYTLMYGKASLDVQEQIAQKQTELNGSKMLTLKKEVEFYEQQYQAAVDAYGADSEAAVKLYNLKTEKQKEYWKSEEEYAKSVNEEYIAGINKAYDEFSRKMSGGLSLDEVDEEWRHMQKMNEGVYDDNQALTQRTKLRLKSEALIAKTSAKNQAKVKKYTDEINKGLEEREELTEYDVTLAEKKLKLMEAQMALEDAKDNKTKMRMRRDANGNWTYNYVADESDINSKKQDVTDATSDLYDTAKNENVKRMQSIYDLYKEFYNSSLKLETDLKNGLITQEDYNTQKAKLKEQFDSDLAILKQRLQITEEDLSAAALVTVLNNIELEKTAQQNLTEEQKRMFDAAREAGVTAYEAISGSANEEFGKISGYLRVQVDKQLPEMQTSAKKIVDALRLDPSNPNSFSVLFSNLGKSTEDLAKTWSENMAKCDSWSQISVGNIIGGFQGINTAIQAAEAEADKLLNPDTGLAKGLNNASTAVQELKKAWEDMISPIQSAIDKIKEWLQLQGQTKTFDSNPTPDNGGAQQTPTTGGGGSTPATTTTSTTGNSKTYTAKAVVTENGVTADEETGTSTESQEAAQDAASAKAHQWASQNATIPPQYRAHWEVYDQAKKAMVTKYGNWQSTIPTNNGKLKWGYETSPKQTHQYQVIPYDTGGYTGDWNGGDGRIAMLHSKELVLNAKDTENMLEMVSAVRSITANVGTSISSVLQNKLADYAASANPAYSVRQADTSGVTNNTYNITAEFPNANSVDEIREAILSLPRLASQYKQSYNRQK